MSNKRKTMDNLANMSMYNSGEFGALVRDILANSEKSQFDDLTYADVDEWIADLSKYISQMCTGSVLNG